MFLRPIVAHLRWQTPTGCSCRPSGPLAFGMSFSPQLIYSRSRKSFMTGYSALSVSGSLNVPSNHSQQSDPSSTGPKSGARRDEHPASPSRSHAIGEGLRGHALHKPTSFVIHASDATSLLFCWWRCVHSVRARLRKDTPTRRHNDGTAEAHSMAASGTYMIRSYQRRAHKGLAVCSALSMRADPSQCRVVAPAAITGYISYQGCQRNGPGWQSAAGCDAACFDLHDALGRGVSMDESSFAFHTPGAAFRTPYEPPRDGRRRPPHGSITTIATIPCTRCLSRQRRQRSRVHTG